MIANRQKFCYIIGLILNTLAVVCMAGRKAVIANLLAVQSCFIQSACSDVQTGRLDLSRNRNMLAEAIYGIPLTFLDLIVSGDPFCFPVGVFQQTHFKGTCGNFTSLAVFVPELYAPIDFFPAVQGLPLIENVGHPGRCNLPGIPYYFVAAFCNDLISGLFRSALCIPVQAWGNNVNTYGIYQVFCSKAHRFHLTSS